MQAEAVTPLHTPRRPVALYTVDWYGRRLLDYDLGHYNATAVAPFLSSAPTPVSLTRGVGHAAFALRAPRVGEVAVTLTAPGLGSAAMAVLVTDGIPQRLVLVTQPHPTTDNRQPLETQPTLALHDAAGNAVSHPPLPPGSFLSARATVQPPAPRDEGGARAQFKAAFESSRFAFRDVVVVAQYDAPVRLRFELVPTPGVALPGVTSHAIRARDCTAAQFYIPGETWCRPCVAGAQCDGSARLRTRVDHWRLHNTTRRFVQCPAWLPHNTCLAGHEVGACAPHHTGPLCAGCVEGHAGARCGACAFVSAAAQLTAFAVGIGMIFVWTTFRAFQQVLRPTPCALHFEGRPPPSPSPSQVMGPTGTSIGIIAAHFAGDIPAGHHHHSRPRGGGAKIA